MTTHDGVPVVQETGEQSRDRLPCANNIEVNSFALRQFTADARGTRITSHTSEAFLAELKQHIDAPVRVKDGYAEFCKIVFVENFTDAKVGDIEITSENMHMMRSGYVARREGELPVLTRWVEGVKAPVASHLGIVFYSKEQLQKEFDEGPKDSGEAPPQEEWGVILVMGVAEPEETPMNPMTMLRNSLGVGEGGSGVPMDKDAYMKSVAYWETHAVIKED